VANRLALALLMPQHQSAFAVEAQEEVGIAGHLGLEVAQFSLSALMMPGSDNTSGNAPHQCLGASGHERERLGVVPEALAWDR
jgi:hypothetical protein